MISFAPMEGIGTCYYRRVHYRMFPEGIDRYYTPFLSVYPNLAFHKRDLREIRPKAEDGPEDLAIRRMLVPQILARTSGEILWAAEKLASFGFREINLNMGCPSGTVVKKGGGSGMLADPEALNRLFDEVFSHPVFSEKKLSLSVKTRLGLSEPEEFYRILPVLSRYPLSEIILHPRVRAEQYSGTPHRDIFCWTLEHTALPVAYNGDLFTAEDIASFREAFPTVQHLMLGRGVVSDPALARQVSGGAPLTLPELKAFVAAVTEAYTAILDNERQLLLKLKELWFYMGALFVSEEGKEAEAFTRKIRMARDMGEYRNALRTLYAKCHLGGHFGKTVDF